MSSCNSSKQQTRRLLVLTLLACICNSLIAGERKALVIGIQEYDQAGNLQSSRADARRVAETFSSTFGFDVTVLIDDGDAVHALPTRTNILAKLQQFKDQLSEEDEFIIYFAGHGYFDSSIKQTFLLTEASVFDNIEAESIRAQVILDYIYAMKSNRKIVILDHCYSGQLAYLSPAGELAPPPNASNVGANFNRRAIKLPFSEPDVYRPEDPSAPIILAAARTEAYENEDTGFFTSVLLDALNYTIVAESGIASAALIKRDGNLPIRAVTDYIQLRFNELDDSLNSDSLPDRYRIIQDPVITANGDAFSRSASWNLNSIRLEEYNKQNLGELFRILEAYSDGVELTSFLENLLARRLNAYRVWSDPSREYVISKINDNRLFSVVSDIRRLYKEYVEFESLDEGDTV